MTAHPDFSHYSPIMENREIQDILPHRYPFLLVDKVLHIDLEENMIVAQKNVTINEPFFQGHFPSAPIMPGVLLVEALAQAGGILIHQKGFVGKIAVLLNVSHAKFRNPVKPGDTLYLKVEGLHFSNKGGRIKGTAFVNKKIALEGEISFALVNKEQI